MNNKTWKIVGILHFFVGAILIPGSIFLSSYFFIAVGIWLIILGVGFLRNRESVLSEAAAAHKFLCILSGLLSLYGVWALYMGNVSSQMGGGIMSAYGLIPLSVGILLLIFSCFTIRWLRNVKSSSK